MRNWPEELWEHCGIGDTPSLVWLVSMCSTCIGIFVRELWNLLLLLFLSSFHQSFLFTVHPFFSFFPHLPSIPISPTVSSPSSLPTPPHISPPTPPHSPKVMWSTFTLGSGLGGWVVSGLALTPSMNTYWRYVQMYVEEYIAHEKKGNPPYQPVQNIYIHKSTRHRMLSLENWGGGLLTKLFLHVQGS